MMITIRETWEGCGVVVFSNLEMGIFRMFGMQKHETAGAAGSARVNSWFEENPSPSPEMEGPAL